VNALAVSFGLWAVWLAYWLISAFFTRRTARSESASSRLVYSLILAAGYILLFGLGIGLGPLDARILPADAAIQWAGVAITVAGLAFSVWARIHLGALWSGRITLKEGHRVIQSGPYALVRHPIYTGLLLAMTGTATTVGLLRSPIGVVVAAISFVIKYRREEAMLSQSLPEYSEYRGRVRALIPFVF
jgi:protein-S-isoprenylcysteine O-methyltransferase Ste14